MPLPAPAPAAARRTSWVRRALFQVHLWTGLALGLYALAISVSGSLLVYSPVLGEWTHRDLRAVPLEMVEGRVVVTPAEAVARVAAALPGRPLLNVQVAAAPHRAHVVGLLEQSQYQVAFVHPVTGAVSAPVHGRGAVLGWLDRLHSNFFSGRPGRVANGIGALLLVLLSVTGIVIWWPGRAGVGRALRVDWRAGWKRVVFDLHHALGAWLLVPVLVLSLTGAYFTWPQITRDLISRISPVTRAAAPRSRAARDGSPVVSLDAVIARVQQANPAHTALRVDLPGGATSPYLLVSSAHPHAGPRQSTMTFVDRYSGETLEVRHGSQARTWGDTVVAWLPPLHSGHFGGPVVHAIWAVLGLAPAVLFCTGFLMWWNRVVVPRRRRGRRHGRGA